MTRKLTTLLGLALLLGGCGILPGGKSNPAPSATPNSDTVLTAAAPSPPTALPTSTPVSTMTPTPAPTSTASPPPPARVEVTGPGAYPGDLPYLTAIKVYLTTAQAPVLVEASCDGTLLRPDAAREQTLHPGQSAAFFFVIPPGHASDCRVAVAGQECGQWTVALGIEEPMTMVCAVEAGEP